MSIMSVFIIICVVLFLVIIALSFFALVDWRGWLVRKYGANPRKGLAHIQYDSVWVYRESELIYEGEDALSYARQVIEDGRKTYTTDIVPNDIGYSYDEYTGARVYRVAPGGAVATSDDGVTAAVDYDALLISAHVQGRTAVQFASSVSAGSGGSGLKVFAIIAVIAVLIAGAVFAFQSGMIPGFGKADTTTPPAITENVTNGIPPAGTVRPVDK